MSDMPDQTKLPPAAAGETTLSGKSARTAVPIANIAKWLILAIIALYCLFNDSISVFLGITCVMIAYSFLEFLKRSGTGIRLVDWILIISGMQWFVFAHFAYLSDISNPRHQMQLPESEYMYNTFLAYIGYWCGLRFWEPKIIIWSNQNNDVGKRFWNIVRTIGVLLLFANVFFQSFFTSLGPWMILGYLLYQISRRNKLKLRIFCLAALNLYLLSKSIISSMFHMTLLFLLFELLFLIPMFKISIKKILPILFSVVLFINALQISKKEYRNLLNDNLSAVSRIELFNQLFWNNFIEYSGNENDSLNRYNQGWLISHVYVFMDGKLHRKNFKHFVDSLVAIVFPRILNPEKRKSGGADNLYNFAGLTLTEKTSMNISTVGEGYAYFGRYGSIVFHFILGSLLSLVLRLLVSWEKNYGIGVFLIPCVFFLAIRAESDFMTGYNALFKTLVMFALILWFSNRQSKSLLSAPGIAKRMES